MFTHQLESPHFLIDTDKDVSGDRFVVIRCTIIETDKEVMDFSRISDIFDIIGSIRNFMDDEILSGFIDQMDLKRIFLMIGKAF